MKKSVDASQDVHPGSFIPTPCYATAPSHLLRLSSGPMPWYHF